MNTNNVLLVVGNGFDLCMGMKTGYKEFLKSGFFEIGYEKYRLNEGLFTYLDKKNELENWIDVEAELGRFCTEYLYKFPSSNYKKIDKELHREYQSLCYCLNQYLKQESQKACHVTRDNSALQLIEDIYQHTGMPVNIITFNYTNTLEKLKEFNICNHIGEVFYVHGSLNDDGTVFGVEDSVQLRKEHQFLYKSASNYKKANEFAKRLYSADTIFFFGYSLGTSDHSYFEDFFRMQTNYGCSPKEIILYYHEDQARYDLIWQLRELTNKKYNKLEMYNKITYLRSNAYHSYYI